MTAAIAEVYNPTHLDLVRDEYARTKTDHALDDGCDSCAVGVNPDRIAGWAFVHGLFLCPRCAEAERRSASEGKKTCINGHDWVPDNLFERPAAGGGIRHGCLPCQRDRSRKAQIKRRAARAAS